MLLRSLLLAALPASLFAQSAPTPQAGMLRYPDVSQDKIVFVYANDLWLVSRDGGTATPLASPQGAERFPRFSPDGQTLAFVGNYDGDTDLYTVPLTGGLPTRVTHSPGPEHTPEWTSDGRLTFSSSAFSGLGRAPRMFAVSASGGLPEALPIPYGLNGTIHAGGDWLAYTPNSRDARNWKRYVGGMATDLWLFHLQDKTSRQVTTWHGTDSFPMWHGDNLYYVSDRGSEQRLNVWKFDPGSGDHQQITSFTDYDVKWPAMGPGDRGQGEIVFQNNAGLFLLDLASGEAREVRVEVPGVVESVRPQAQDVSSLVMNSRVSPSGKRAVIEARGDVWTLPAAKGSPRNLTGTSGVAERDPAWSPDGRWVAYFSDATGEYELWVTQSDGRGETRQLTQGTEGYKYDPTWSPDSSKIAFSDRSGSLNLHDIEAGTTVKVDQHPMAEWGLPVRWSHDSRWLTYTNLGEESMTSSVHLYDVQAGQVHQVTSDMFNAASPTFDRKGDWLYYASGRNFSSQTTSQVDSNYLHEDVYVLHAVPLRADVEFPWAPESDEESWEDEDEASEEDADEGEGDDEGEAEVEPAADDDGVTGAWSGTLTIPGMGDFPITLTLELDGDQLDGEVSSPLGNASIEGTLDVASGRCTGQVTADDGSVMPFEGTLSGGSFRLNLTTPDGEATLVGERAGGGSDDGDEGDSDEAGEPAEVVEIELEGFEARALLLPVQPGLFNALAVNHQGHLLYARIGDNGGIKLYDLHGDEQAEQAVTGGRGFLLSADGKHLMVQQGNLPAIGKAAKGSTPKAVRAPDLRAQVDPRQEWPQVYRDAWRIFRDYFYAANMHGVDWEAVYEQYRPMIDYCVTREDVDYVLREMVAELNAGHAYVRGGPMERGPSRPVGLLGCDYSLENGAYRIAHIVEGGPWDSDARGPLSYPGVDVHEGDYLLEVDGVPVDTSKDPWAAFVGKAGQAVELTVSAEPTLDDSARRVRVKTLTSERTLRYREWIEGNRAAVEEASGGRVGYVYVPDTGQNGRNNFFRQLYGQVHLDALIIDERWNGGGQFPNREIEALDRPRTNYWGRRWGRPFATPNDSHQGPKCMLINRDSGSGGDMFPYLFRQAGLGKLIGTRTWGGLIGYSGSPRLIDGGVLSVPSFGFYELDGTWGVEGHGVDPDIEVIDDPALMQGGADPQLERAVAEMLAELEGGTYVPVPQPADPDRSGLGLPDSDR